MLQTCSAMVTTIWRPGFTHCNQPVTCLAKSWQHKLQRQLQHITLAVELTSVIAKIFYTIASCSNAQHFSCNLRWIYFFSVARQVAREIALCNISLKVSIANNTLWLKLVLHTIQFSLQFVSQRLKKIIASCRIHATRCNLGMHLAMVSKICAIIKRSRIELYSWFYTMQFFCILSCNVRKTNPLQVAGDMLQVAILRRNLQWFQKVSAIVKRSRTEL